MKAAADLAIADALAARGWCVIPAFCDTALTDALRAAALARRDAGEFRAARVGRGERAADVPALRGDAIRWLEPDDPDPAVRTALARFDALRTALNRSLYLGLETFEAHFACYPPGARYGLHVDRFRDDDARIVSVVLYLNPDWHEEDGGQLRLYLERAGAPPFEDVVPAGGRLAVFLSERFAHEVLPAMRERLSLTGWFRRRA